MPVRENRLKKPRPCQAAPSLVPVPAPTTAKARASSHTLLGFSAETDSPLEGDGFEIPVPRQIIKACALS